MFQGGVVQLNRPPINSILVFSVISIEDTDAPVFSLANPTYAQQLRKGYPTNVFRNGIWGTYITTSLTCNVLSPVESAYLGLTYKIGETTAGFITANPAVYK